MKVLFLTMTRFESFEGRGIYIDLLNYFKERGHEVCVVAPKERRHGGKTSIQVEDGAKILNVKTLNLVKTSIIEKGIGQLLLERQFLRAIKKYLPNEKFDLVLYSTPPITFAQIIRFVKERDNAHAYLLLKDIFPQNAVDMGMLKKNGWIHWYFRKKEKALYEISDTIGCMSEANKRYIIDHNPELDESKIEVNPNTIIPAPVSYGKDKMEAVRMKYGLPVNKKIFIYGGNLGKPQGIDFLIEVLKNLNEPNIHVLIVGDGTEYKKLKQWFDSHKPDHATLYQSLPKEEYDRLLGSCDVGLIFLDRQFTIPNFPSRLLSYLEMKMPVISATDRSTDIGKVIEEAGCGISVRSGDVESMLNSIREMAAADLQPLKENAWRLLKNNYTVERSYKLIAEKAVN